MAPRFLSKEWATETQRALDESPSFRKAVDGLETSILTIVTDTPNGGLHYLYYEFKEGYLTKLETGKTHALAKRQAKFTIIGPYETFEELYRGTLTVQGAYFRRKVKIQGSMVDALRFAPAFIKYNEVARGVETEF